MNSLIPEALSSAVIRVYLKVRKCEKIQDEHNKYRTYRLNCLIFRSLQVVLFAYRIMLNISRRKGVILSKRFQRSYIVTSVSDLCNGANQENVRQNFVAYAL